MFLGTILIGTAWRQSLAVYLHWGIVRHQLRVHRVVPYRPWPRTVQPIQGHGSRHYLTEPRGRVFRHPLFTWIMREHKAGRQDGSPPPSSPSSFSDPRLPEDRPETTSAQRRDHPERSKELDALAAAKKRWPSPTDAYNSTWRRRSRRVSLWILSFPFCCSIRPWSPRGPGVFPSRTAALPDAGAYIIASTSSAVPSPGYPWDGSPTGSKGNGF